MQTLHWIALSAGVVGLFSCRDGATKASHDEIDRLISDCRKIGLNDQHPKMVHLKQIADEPLLVGDVHTLLGLRDSITRHQVVKEADQQMFTSDVVELWKMSLIPLRNDSDLEMFYSLMNGYRFNHFSLERDGKGWLIVCGKDDMQNLHRNLIAKNYGHFGLRIEAVETQVDLNEVATAPAPPSAVRPSQTLHPFIPPGSSRGRGG